MSASEQSLTKLRQLITENLRIQRGQDEQIQYIDVGTVLDDICARQNHTIFARRGCGKTLLLHHSAKLLDPTKKAVYLNCEDFKRHSFPNVLIEILDSLFRELEDNLTGWFGKKKKSRQLIQKIREELSSLKVESDNSSEEVTKKISAEQSADFEAKTGVKAFPIDVNCSSRLGRKSKEETERRYTIASSKLKELDLKLPSIKQRVRDFFDASSTVKAVFLQIDDLYHLKRADQPFVVDYIHRLCKDVPLYFKIATLRHASTLYADRDGQPVGAQERHDYQSINIDYTFTDFRKTAAQNRMILGEFAKLAGMSSTDVDELFKGEGFARLVMAGGGVPRDTLSLFLDVHTTVKRQGDGRIGKDDVRILSRSNFERRIEELKQDSEGTEQDTLIKGIYVLREFCLRMRTNVFVVSERELQQQDDFKDLINRLLDYRIIHCAGSAITHKSQSGTFQAFAIDIGCYAHFRKLDGRFNEVDVSSQKAKEKMRSSPVLDEQKFSELWERSPADNVENALLADPTE